MEKIQNRPYTREELQRILDRNQFRFDLSESDYRNTSCIHFELRPLKPSETCFQDIRLKNERTPLPTQLEKKIEDTPLIQEYLSER